MKSITAPNLVPCEARTGGPAWRAAEAAGHDMSLIVEALRMPVWERLKANDSALSLALALRQAMKEQHGGPRSNSDASH